MFSYSELDCLDPDLEKNTLKWVREFWKEQ